MHLQPTKVHWVILKQLIFPAQPTSQVVEKNWRKEFQDVYLFEFQKAEHESDKLFTSISI